MFKQRKLAIAAVTGFTLACGAGAAQAADIVETASAVGSFSTLVQLLEATGMDVQLRGEGPYTVFAPTDDAFAALGEDTLNTLLQPENRMMLREILTYHVMPRMATSGDFANGAGAYITLAYQFLPWSGLMGDIRVDGVPIEAADVEASNGVIHVIDGVLLP